MIYGYARVSTVRQAAHGNSVEAQEKLLREHGAVEIFTDSYTGTTTDRPEFNKLLAKLESGDTLVCTKLDRIARSASQGSELIQDLLNRGVKVHIINMGLVDSSPTGKLITNVLFAFAEFERDLIVARTQEGRRIARANRIASGEEPNDHRPHKYSRKQLDHAMMLKERYSFSQVAELTGISRATLAREARRRKIAKVVSY